MLRPNLYLTIAIFCLAAALHAAEPPARIPAPATRKVDYSADIQPLLARHCLKCHGPDKQESGYRLDQKAAALRGGELGEKPFVIGHSEESFFIKAVAHTLPDLKMPPEAARLTDDEIGLLRAWIDQGLTWDGGASDDKSLPTDHWSLQPIKAELPKTPGAGRASTAIDAFLLDKLSTKNLGLSPPANPRPLIRRFYFDLIGLPPTPEEIAEFAADTRPDAIARLADQLLASPHYGERWARHWLDVARFAETNGFETNTPRPDAYHFRDYVIRAFNSDKPYDQFLFEQLAGDACGEDAATGFLVGGAYDTVKSPDIGLTLMQRQDEYADMISTTGMAFLGLTTGCARCHNHKFDPITQQDYYSLQAVFAGVQHGSRPLPEKNGDINTLAPQRQLAEATSRAAALDRELAEITARYQPLASAQETAPVAPQRPAVNARLNHDRFPPVRIQSLRFISVATNSGEPCLDELEIYAAPELGREAGNVAAATAGAKLSSSGDLAGFEIHKLSHLNDGLYGNSHSWISNQPGRSWVQIDLANPQLVERVVWGRDREGKFSDRLPLQYRIEGRGEDGQWRLLASSLDRIPFGAPEANLPEAANAGLPASALARIKALAEERKSLEARIKQYAASARVYAGLFSQPGPIHRLYRGDPQQQREETPPDALAVFGSLQLKTETPEQQRRIALAKWLTRPDQPLPARVMANRIWQHHFGVGLVSTPSDFGKNGATPSHPQLLDWLASELVRGEWSIKRLHRRILATAAYQQSSAPNPAALAADADCRLLWRYPPRRLDAEALRDSVLAVTGSLDQSMFGPGFSVFMPNDNYVRVYAPKEDWTSAEWRRMIYMYKVRMEQDPVFGLFDCPDAGQPAAKRSRSTTALQALNLLNSTFMLQQSERFAERLRAEAPSNVAAQVQHGFSLALGRQPHADELAAAAELANCHGLPALCRAILNTNEFSFVP